MGLPLGIVVFIVLVIVIISFIIWISYRHVKRSNLEKIHNLKKEQKLTGLNMEELNFKALDTPTDSRGKLIYIIKYIKKSQELIVTVKSGHDLIPVIGGGTTDPYVNLWLKENPKMKFKTKIKKRTLNPVYNEDFRFSVSSEKISSQSLMFSLCYFQKYSYHDQIGYLQVDLSSLDLSKTIEDCAELDPPQSDMNNEIPLGDICICLKYDPNKEKLLVNILEGKEFKKDEEGDVYDSSYVKVSIEMEKKIIKKKITKTKKNTQNPYFNEEFLFNLQENMITKVQLVITAFSCDVKKNNKVIGYIVLGSSNVGPGLKHWSEMIDNPKKSIAQWHSLVEVIEKHK